jgi:hypothetical protein
MRTRLRRRAVLTGVLLVAGELEFDAEEGEVADAAIGLKWVPIGDRASAGIEVLALLPVEGVGSTLGELVLGRFRPGVELAAGRVLGDAAGTSAVVGAGLIVALGPVDVRGGVHAGLYVSFRRIRPPEEALA